MKQIMLSFAGIGTNDLVIIAAVKTVLDLLFCFVIFLLFRRSWRSFVCYLITLKLNNANILQVIFFMKLTQKFQILLNSVQTKLKTLCLLSSYKVSVIDCDCK